MHLIAKRVAALMFRKLIRTYAAPVLNLRSHPVTGCAHQE